MDISQYSFEIRRHAFIRALERSITPDMIEATLKGGTVKRFGKRNVKFSKEHKNFTVICVGEIIGTSVRIFTVEKGE